MSKINLFLASSGAVAAMTVMSLLGSVAHAQDYLIQSSDTIPIFENGAAAVKSNGVAILNIAVPYLAGAAVAFGVILILWVVVGYFLRHRA